MKEIKNNIAMSVVILLVSIVLLVSCGSIQQRFDTGEVGPRFVPYLVSALLALLALIHLITNVLQLRREKAVILQEGQVTEEKKEELAPEENASVWRCICAKYGQWFIIGTMLVCVLLMKQVGFIASGSVILFVSMYMIAPAQERKPLFFLVLSIGVTVILYLMFREVFSLMLPKGDLWGQIRL